MPKLLSLLMLIPLLGGYGLAHAEPVYILDRAEKQLSLMEYDKAIETATEAVHRGGNSIKDLKRAYTILAHGLAVLGQDGPARDYYTKLLVIDPKFSLSKDVSPKVRAPLITARSDRAGRPGIVAVHRPPTSARYDEQLVLRIQVIEDPLDMVKGASVHYRLPGRGKPSTLGVGGDEKELVLALPLTVLGAHAGTLTYDINLLDVYNNVVWSKRAVDVQLVGDAPPVAAAVTAESGSPWYTRWWVWTIAGVVVAGAATAAIVVATQPNESDVAMSWEVGP